MGKPSFLVFAALLSLQCAMAGEQPSAIPKPGWQIGQSWVVRCPIISHICGPNYDTATDTGRACMLTYTVLRKERIGRSECWAVRISTDGDFAGTAETLYVYYRTNDLSLMREPYPTDLFLGKDGAPIYKEGIACPDAFSSYSFVLVEMPVFPLAPGKEQSRLLCDSRRDGYKQPDPKEDTLLTARSVSHVEAAPEEGPGAVRVTLKLVETRSKSGVSTRDYEEQVWMPGKPWWTSAMVPRDIAKRTLSQGGQSK